MASMSKVITKPPKPPLKKLVCKLLGVPKTKTVPFRLDSDVKTLQHHIKTKFNSNVDARDIMLFPTKHVNTGKWLEITEVEKIAKVEAPKELKCALYWDQLIEEETPVVSEVFRSAPEEGVIHIVAKECPVHPTRAARWEAIRRMLPPLEPRAVGESPKTTLSKDEWYELYEHTYEPQLQRHSEAVTFVDSKVIDELVETLEEPLDAFWADIVHGSYLRRALMPCKRRHPDISVSANGMIEGYRVKYRGSKNSTMFFKGSTILLGQTRCDDVKRDIAHVLTQCEAAADSCDLHEVYGVVVTSDGKWIFLRSLDDKILIDDDDDNRLVFGEGGKPSRESVAKIAGKLHGMVMTHVPPPPPGWSYWFEDEDEYDDDEEEEDY